MSPVQIRNPAIVKGKSAIYPHQSPVLTSLTASPGGGCVIM